MLSLDNSVQAYLKVVERKWLNPHSQHIYMVSVLLQTSISHITCSCPEGESWVYFCRDFKQLDFLSFLHYQRRNTLRIMNRMKWNRSTSVQLHLHGVIYTIVSTSARSVWATLVARFKSVSPTERNSTVPHCRGNLSLGGLHAIFCSTFREPRTTNHTEEL